MNKGTTAAPFCYKWVEMMRVCRRDRIWQTNRSIEAKILEQFPCAQRYVSFRLKWKPAGMCEAWVRVQRIM